MSKKASSQKNEAKPQTAQVDAIRNLLSDEEFATAWTRLRALRKQFPNFKPLLALAFEAADGAGLDREALMCAYDWVQASPNSVDALQALGNAAFEGDYGALAGDAFLRLTAIEGGDLVLPESSPTAFGDMSQAEMVLADTSRILLNAKRFHDVIARLQDARFPSLISNLGLAHFALGDITMAAQKFTQSWQANENNLFAAEKQLRLLLWLHGADAIRPLLPVILAVTPLRMEDALAKLSSLILLQEWDLANDYCIASLDEPFRDEEVDAQLDEWFDYLAASVALRLGDAAEAERRLESALGGSMSYPPLRELALHIGLSPNLVGLAAPSCVVGEFLAWFPSTWVDRIFDMQRIVAQLSDAQFEARTAPIFAACDAHHDYLATAIELGGRQVTLLGLEVLKYRAKCGDSLALDTLMLLLTRPIGIDQDRFDLLRWLQDFGFVSDDGTTPLLARGQIASIKTQRLEVTSEATSNTPYPEEGQVLYEKMLALLKERKLEQALAVAQTIYDRYPNIAMSAGNLAMAKENLQHPSEEIETLFQHALSINKDYKFARAGLARIFARRGDPDAADAMLAPVLVEGRFHASEWRSVLLAQMEIAKARSDFPAMERAIVALNEMAARTG